MAPVLRPDILLLDIDLPGMNGIQLVQELAPRLPNTKIVMLTVSSSERDLLDAVARGAAGYLTKDLSPEALLRTLRGVQRGELAMLALSVVPMPEWPGGALRLACSTRRASSSVNPYTAHGMPPLIGLPITSASGCMPSTSAVGRSRVCPRQARELRTAPHPIFFWRAARCRWRATATRASSSGWAAMLPEAPI